MKGRTYRYMTGKAQYPFGYGLNYGEVSVTDAKVESTSVKSVEDSENATGSENTSATKNVADVKNASNVSLVLDRKHIAGLATDGKIYEATIDVIVKNSGKVDTEDVVQVYIQAVGNSDATPNPMLAGMKRVYVPAGQTVNVTLTVKDPSFTVVTDEGERVHSTGAYKLYVGTSQPDERSAELTGAKSCEVEVTF